MPVGMDVSDSLMLTGVGWMPDLEARPKKGGEGTQRTQKGILV